MKLILFLCCFASYANNFIDVCLSLAALQRGTVVLTEFWVEGFVIEHFDFIKLY